MRRIGATTDTPVNPNDTSDDPSYTYRPLAAHAAAIRSDERRREIGAARVNAARTYRQRAAAQAAA